MKEINLNIQRPLIVGDLHLSEYSSIIRKKGMRLSHIVKTLNWIINLAQEQYCDSIIFLGDFFDKPELNAAELTALQEVKWPIALNYLCLVGNHEMGAADLSCSSTHILNQIPNFHVIDEPTIIDNKYVKYLFLPYIVEDSKRDLTLYCEGCESDKLIIFSHNDLKGVDYGKFISKQGFEISDIEEHCVAFLNGHLHNKNSILDRILNVGNITGQNFSEDAFKYPHNAYIMPVKDWVEGAPLQCLPFTNPYAFNFYKIDLTINNCLDQLNNLEANAVLSIKCFQKDIDNVKEAIEANTNIIEYRIINILDNKFISQTTLEELTKVDHIEKFKEFVIDQLGASDYVLKELQEISQ